MFLAASDCRLSNCNSSISSTISSRDPRFTLFPSSSPPEPYRQSKNMEPWCFKRGTLFWTNFLQPAPHAGSTISDTIAVSYLGSYLWSLPVWESVFGQNVVSPPGSVVEVRHVHVVCHGTEVMHTLPTGFAKFGLTKFDKQKRERRHNERGQSHSEKFSTRRRTYFSRVTSRCWLPRWQMCQMGGKSWARLSRCPLTGVNLNRLSLNANHVFICNITRKSQIFFWRLENNGWTGLFKTTNRTFFFWGLENNGWTGLFKTTNCTFHSWTF